MPQRKTRKLRSKDSFQLSAYAKNLSIVESDMWMSKLIFDNRTNNVHALNVTGKIIWDTMSDRRRVGDYVDKVLYWCNGETDRSRVERDVTEFLVKLRDVGLLLTRAEGGGFPSGIKVSVTQNQKGVRYTAPALDTYSKRWLEQNHPSAFFHVLFSDTWGPAHT